MPLLGTEALQKIRSGQLALGLGIHHLRGATAPLLAKAAGYDWLFIDAEHGAITTQEASQISLAALAVGVAPIVRICAGALDEGTRALDNGALGIIAAANPGSPWDVAARPSALLGQAIPAFWLGTLLILVFAVELKWLPSSGAEGFAGLVFEPENHLRDLPVGRGQRQAFARLGGEVVGRCKLPGRFGEFPGDRAPGRLGGEGNRNGGGIGRGFERCVHTGLAEGGGQGGADGIARPINRPLGLTVYCWRIRLHSSAIPVS